jgi:hypothetical protein
VVATVEFGGWDTHEDQGNDAGQFANQVDALARALGAFYNDLDTSATNYMKRVTVVVISEFGRRLKENASTGTDHGHGNVMLLLGENVHGGRMFGSWPGLAPENLDNSVDLAITTDYRAVLSEVLIRRLRNPDLAAVFPGLTTYAPSGIVAGTDLTPILDGDTDSTGTPTRTPTRTATPTPTGTRSTTTPIASPSGTPVDKTGSYRVVLPLVSS